VSPASNRALHQSETVQPSALPDLKPNSKQPALSCAPRLLVFPHMLRSSLPSNLPMMQDLLPDLSSSNMDRVMHAERISVNAPSWQSACNPLVNGKRHGIPRTPQFDERYTSLVPRTAFRCVFSGLWRSRWFGADTAPSSWCNRQPHTVFGFRAARHTTNFYGGRHQFDERSRELECEWNLWRQCGGRDDQHERRLHFAG
jgi:hypothetical protein